MLFSIESDGSIRPITRVPHAHDFDLWRSRLNRGQFGAIIDELNGRIDADEIHTSSWMPGADWTGTVFQPIYDVACDRDFDASARFFGLILWQVMMDRPDRWSFGRYQKDNTPIEGLTYFRIR